MSIVEPKPSYFGEQRVRLNGIRWSTYVALVEDRGDDGGGRVTYDQGVLEIMAPGRSHENIGCLLGRMVEAFTEELEIEIVSVASTTFRREDVERGFEADESYYIQHADSVAAKDELDLAVDPPPDLVIEIDMTNSSIPKLPLFFELRVPEVWRYASGELVVHVRGENEFVASDTSTVLPLFPLSQARAMIENRREVGETKLMRNFRDWVRKNLLTH